jgi:ergothioneine biosynthesis protein EgtB
MSVLNLYLKTRKRTEAICSPLKTEDYIPQLEVFASPPKWHLAHTNWFFEEMILKKYASNFKGYDEKYGFLFNSYYNSLGDKLNRGNRGVITRPTVVEVYEYRKYIDGHMTELLTNNTNKEVEKLTVLGLNHEQQHQELMLTDLKYALGHNPIFPVYDKAVNLVEVYNEEDGFSEVTEGVYSVGFDQGDFCFDNELGRHKVYLNDFSISKALVTNGDYIKFIEAGGYQKFNYWLDEGWSWIAENKIESPLYWHKIESKWHYFTLSGLKAVDENAILSHVSFYEANAFASWKGMRLPTEFEWEIASDSFKWGTRWEWTNSAYLPYPGFKIAEGAVGEYNGKFMISQMVLRGASEATTKGHSRKTYRNFFHPKSQWQFSGIRLVK